MAIALNPQQEEVARHVYGRILTLAGPGSGKTRTLSERTGRLIRHGIDPSNILCLTFTNKARDEMRQRIADSHGARAEKVYISNFHGLGGMMLRKLGEPLGYTPRMTILDSDDQIDLILQIARKRGLEPSRPQARVMAFICNDWRENLGDDEALEDLCSTRLNAAEVSVIRAYVRELRVRNQCDFSGLLSEMHRLLIEHPAVQTRLQTRFRFIQVDEYQDTNRAQNAIVELLAGSEDNVLAVGDGDQSIYEWRGATPDAIPQFIRNGEKKTGSCKVVKLGVNYRSTPEIVATADRLIRHCGNRIPVDFASTAPGGDPVKCAKLDTPEIEAEAVASSIANLMRSVQPREIAVFYRANDMSRLIEQALAKRQIPCQVIGGGSYYDRMEVKDVLSMLRFVCNPRDGISFARVANKPSRGMGDALIGRIEAYAETHHLDLMTAMEESKHAIRDEHDRPLAESALRAIRETRAIFDLSRHGRSILDIVNELLDRSRYDQWLKERYEAKGEYESRRQNVNELVNAIAEFSRRNRTATIADYLQSISLYTEGDDGKNENGVKLMSLHASKGLEFDAVFMIGVEHGILPHEKAVMERGERGLDEERRLCYVGFTRARKILRVTWCSRRQDTFARDRAGRFRPSRPSRFLLEAGLVSESEFQSSAPEARTAKATAPSVRQRIAQLDQRRGHPR